MTGAPAGVAAFVPDLMDRSRMPAGTRFVDDPALLGAAPEPVLVVDLARPAARRVLASLTGPGRRVVAFTNHEDGDALAEARDAGCVALPRSRFFADPARWLAAGPPGP